MVGHRQAAGLGSHLTVCRIGSCTIYRMLHDKLDKIQELYESSSFNSYEGPEHPELLIICCGSGKLCSLLRGTQECYRGAFSVGLVC